jgi:HEAT repeat protein
MLGDAHTVASLLRLLTDPQIDDKIVTGALFALSERNYRDAVPDLLALAQQQIRHDTRLIILFILSEIGDEGIADQLASLATNPALDIQMRQFAAIAFVRCGLRTRQSIILSMLADTTLDTILRSSLARGLAEVVDQGNTALREDLRTIYVQERNEPVRFSLTIASGLLGDPLALSRLRVLFGREDFPKYLYQCVAECLVEHTPASMLMEMLTNSQITLAARIALAEAIGSVGTPSLVPELLMVLENRVVIEEVRSSVAGAIEQLGRSRETVERLLRLWKFLRLRETDPSALTDALYQAMWAVSRRAGVIVFQDGFEYKVIERKSLT